MPLPSVKIIATATLIVALSTLCAAADLKIDEITVPKLIPQAQQDAILGAVQLSIIFGTPATSRC